MRMSEDENSQQTNKFLSTYAIPHEFSKPINRETL